MTHQEWLRYAAKWQLDDEAECAALVGAEALDIAEALARRDPWMTESPHLGRSTGRYAYCQYCRNTKVVGAAGQHADDCLYARAVKLMEDHRAE